MTGFQAIVLGYLSKWTHGAAAARPQETIARHLRTLGLANTSARDVRDAVAALSMMSCPVGTSTGGCFMCMTPRDFRIAYRTLYGRLLAQSRRCRTFKKTAREFISGQRRFDFGGAQGAYSQAADAPLLVNIAEDHGRP